MPGQNVFISDLHASMSLPFAQVDEDGSSSDRLRDVTEVLAQAGEAASEGGRLFILGDLFDDRHPDAPTLIAVSRVLRQILDRGAEVYVLPGNHDAHDRSGRVYSLGMFGELQIPGLVIASSPTWVDIGDADVLMVPWVPDHKFPGLEVFSSPFPNPRRQKVLLMHQTISGAREGNHVLNGIRSGPWGGFGCILSGHIHTPQSVVPRMMYLGSPLHLRFSDADDRSPRGFYVHEKGTLLSLENLTLVETVGEISPRFVRWRAIGDDETSPAEILESVLPGLVDELDFDPETYLELIIEGTREELPPATEIAEATIEPLKEHLRFVRISRIAVDDGASERIRARTSTGAPLQPRELAGAFVASNTATIPDGLTADDLVAFSREVL